MKNNIYLKTVDGYDISTEINIAESSDLIIWLHGITETKNEYLNFFKDGSAWFEKNGISSVRFDFRGHGNSSGISSEFSIVGQIIDALTVIDYIKSNFKNSYRIHLVGLSFGAPPSIYLSMKYPDLIKSLTLIAPVLSYKRTFINPETEWAKSLFSETNVNELEKTGKLYFNESFFIGLNLYIEMNLVNPEMFLPKIIQPTLVMHGDKDSMVPYDATNQICKNLSNLNLVTLFGSDHGYMQEGDDEGILKKSKENKIFIYEKIRYHINDS